MKLKFNLGILKDKELRFEKNGLEVCSGVVKRGKSTANKSEITFCDGALISKIAIPDNTMAKCKIRRDGNVVVLNYCPDENVISGMVAFTMFDTYGFPIELTQEILGENKYEVDVEGFNILRELQRELAQGSYKNNDGWNSK